jgi:hypothetical protein
LGEMCVGGVSKEAPNSINSWKKIK